MAKLEPHPRRLSGPERAKLARELTRHYARGRSIRELGTEYHRSYGFIHKMLNDAGVVMRGRGGAQRKKT